MNQISIKFLSYSMNGEYLNLNYSNFDTYICNLTFKYISVKIIVILFENIFT